MWTFKLRKNKLQNSMWKVKTQKNEMQSKTYHIDHNKDSVKSIDMLNLLERLETIEAKNRCLRVQFLDWLSDKLLDWSNRIHKISRNIDSPCIIEIEPRTREESKSARVDKEIQSLRNYIKDRSEYQDKLYDENKKLTKTIESMIEAQREKNKKPKEEK